MKLITFIGLCLIVLIVFLRAYNTLRKKILRTQASEDLAAWANGIRFSNPQLTAMRSLWQWYKSGNRPPADPTLHVNTTVMADLIKKCSPDFIPTQYRVKNHEELRLKLSADLEKIGMDELQAQIVIGMILAKFGPANDSRDVN